MAGKESSKRERGKRKTGHAFHLLNNNNRRDLLTFKASPAPAGSPISEHNPVSLQTISEML